MIQYTTTQLGALAHADSNRLPASPSKDQRRHTLNHHSTWKQHLVMNEEMQHASWGERTNDETDYVGRGGGERWSEDREGLAGRGGGAREGGRSMGTGHPRHTII